MVIIFIVTGAGSGVYPKVDYPTGTWTLVGSPYYIDYDQVISEGNELTIEPGVEIIFNGRYNFLVYGRLNAVGTVTDTIVFTPDDIPIGWHGIRFINTKSIMAMLIVAVVVLPVLIIQILPLTVVKLLIILHPMVEGAFILINPVLI
jgi:hypothetical protein